MLSRFLDTDYISAAGAAASVPSRVGNQQAAIIGETHLNGTALDASLSNDATGESNSDSSSFTTSPVGDADYNIGAALLVLFLVVALGIAFLWRQRRKRRFSLRGNKPFLPTSNGISGNLNQHRRNRSSVSDHRYMPSRNSEGEETNELLAMKKRGGSRSATASSTDLPRGEELFSVGEEDEDQMDSEEKGNLGNPNRKIRSSSSEDGIDARQTSKGNAYNAV